MLRVTAVNIMGRLNVTVHCHAHGDVVPHALWSKVILLGSEEPQAELRALADGLDRCVRSWEQGEWEFSVDCYQEGFMWGGSSWRSPKPRDPRP
jgi:hypothetical protein